MSRTVGPEHAELLGRVDLFAGVDRVTLAKLAAHLHSVPLTSGAVVFREGDPGDAFYLVASGSFGVYVAAQRGLTDTRVSTLGPGAPFGEMALLTNFPRSATIRADTDGEVLRLDRARFLELVQQHPGVALAIAATLSRHLRLANAQLLAATGSPAATTVPPSVSPASEGQPRPGPRPRQRGRARRAALCGVLAGGALLTAWATPPPAGLTASGWHALGTLAAVVPVLALDALPEGVVALALAALWVLGGVARVPVALSGFASASWVLVVSVLAVGAAIASSGLLYRLALWIVAHSRGGFAGQVLALGLAGVLMGPAVPNATSRVTLIAPALTELVEALGYAPGSRAAAGLAMATLIGFGQMAAVFLTSSTTAVLIFAVLPPGARGDLNWVSWAVRAAPANVLLFIGLMAAVIWLYRPRDDAERGAGVRPDALALQRALLGAPSRNEWVSLAVGAALLVGFVTQPLHGIEPAWVAVLALAVMALARAATAETLRAVNWSFALLFGMLASLAGVFEGAHVDRWLAGLVAGTVGELARVPVLFVSALTVLCFAVSLLLRWQAAAPLLTIALGPVAGAAGINPLVVGLVALIACNGFFLPYQSTPYLALYHGTGGRLFTHLQARPAALAYGIVTLLALCASLPAWRAMGLL